MAGKTSKGSHQSDKPPPKGQGVSNGL